MQLKQHLIRAGIKATLTERVERMTDFAREQLQYTAQGNWVSVNFSHGDKHYQYAWYYEDGFLVIQQCDNICSMPDLNIRSRAEKVKHYGNEGTRTILAPMSRAAKRRSRPSRWQVIKQLLQWLSGYQENFRSR